MKRALITGSAGFIGRHMSRELEVRGWQVEGIDLNHHRPTPNKTEQKIRDNALYRFSSNVKTRYDLVVHCAFHIGGRAAIDGKNMNFAKNMQLDSAMFDWAIRTGQKHVLYFSSSAAYPVSMQSQHTHMRRVEKNPDTWQQHSRLVESYGETCYEMSPDLADSNYGYAKAVGERLAADARRNGLAVSVVRPFSGYGEDQSLDYPFPSIIARARTGDLTVWGPPGQTRDWIHVDDVIKGSLAVVESGTTDPVNLCTGVGTEMGHLMAQVYGMASGRQFVAVDEVTYLLDQPTGVFYRVGDPTRFHQYYTPQVSLEEGIRRALMR